MDDDGEIGAMKTIAAALDPLSADERNRVLQWAASRFGAATVAAATAINLATRPLEVAAANGQSTHHETFAELFDAASPSTEREKALVAGYWVQVCQEQPSFASQSLNEALKDLGHGVGNITDSLTALKDVRPALVLQLKKSGTSKQARKTYKLTQEGIKRVQSLIRNEKPTDD